MNLLDILVDYVSLKINTEVCIRRLERINTEEADEFIENLI